MSPLLPAHAMLQLHLKQFPSTWLTKLGVPAGWHAQWVWCMWLGGRNPGSEKVQVLPFFRSTRRAAAESAVSSVQDADGVHPAVMPSLASSGFNGLVMSLRI